MSDHNLVDIIYELTNCDYLSDIKHPIWRQKVVDAILSLETTDFTLQQWTDALAYITSQELSFKTLYEVRQFIEEAKT